MYIPNSHITFSVANEFSEEPYGRYPDDGPHCGEILREYYIVPLLNDFECVTIDMNGTLGYGTSFLEEAFGGLVRVNGFHKDELLSHSYCYLGLPRLTVKHNLESYVETVHNLIREA